MTQTLLIWTGFCVWVAVGALLVAKLCEFACFAAMAFDLCRWHAAVLRKHAGLRRWSLPPGGIVLFFGAWWIFATRDYSEFLDKEGRGHWRYRDWQVWEERR